MSYSFPLLYFMTNILSTPYGMLSLHNSLSFASQKTVNLQPTHRGSTLWQKPQSLERISQADCLTDLPTLIKCFFPIQKHRRLPIYQGGSLQRGQSVA